MKDQRKGERESRIGKRDREDRKERLGVYTEEKSRGERKEGKDSGGRKSGWY